MELMGLNQRKGKPKGHRMHLKDIRRAAKKDKSLMAAKKDKNKLKVLMEELEDYQQQKKDGAKISNKLGASRASKLLRKFDQEVSCPIHLTTCAANSFMFLVSNLT
jgi:hypothetical protein